MSKSDKNGHMAMAKNSQDNSVLNHKGQPRKAPAVRAAHLTKYQFQPGQPSPNPHGRPKEMTTQLKHQLAMRVPNDRYKRTYLQLLIESGVKRAIKKSDALFKEIFDRIEGKMASKESAENTGVRVILMDGIPRPDRSEFYHNNGDDDDENVNAPSTRAETSRTLPGKSS
jgi:uncharacterized protein DUF5681